MESIPNQPRVNDYPPSTYPPLVEGEMVYKIVGQINRQRSVSLYRAYQHYPPHQMMPLIFTKITPWHAIAAHKITKALCYIDNSLLGYVCGTRVGGGQEGVLETPVMYGYDVRWCGAGIKEYKNFEEIGRAHV